MPDKYKFYVICPTCGGDGTFRGTSAEINGGEATCQTCADESPPFGAKIFDGKRHVYAGRFEEVEE